jgi:glycosyltransferase involved in cell wall biosynthesis
METNMLISICIPEYNAEKYIDRNLDSILNQTYPHIEVILYDDASQDNTRSKMFEYSEKYPDKIFSYYSDVNVGIGAAKNAALSHATGDYVFFCDCDDYLKEDHIEALVKTSQECNYPDVVIGGFTRVDEHGKILYERKYRTPREALQQSIPLFNKIFKREFLQKNNILSPIGVILEDVLYQARVIPNNPTIAMVNNCGYVWVRNMSSASNTRLTTFSPNALDDGFAYLIKGKAHLKNEDQIVEMCYYIMQFVCWHLLKSGSGVGRKVMKREYEKAFNYLDNNFPEYKSLSYISFFRPVGTRVIIRYTILGVLLLKKIGLAKPFFLIYSMLNLKKLWPHL